MRNSDAIELAQIVHRYGTPKLDHNVLGKLIDSPSQTRRYQLAQRVRLIAHYRVAGVYDGFLIIYPDPYERVGEQLRDEVETVLKENGVEPRRVNQERLDRLLRKGGSTRVAMSLDSLVAVDDAHPSAPQDAGR
jgi:hypothetical protein